MKDFNWIFFIIFITLPSFTFSQTAKGWKLNPFEKKLFVENKGQFEGLANLPTAPIVFGVDDKGTKIFFTKTGLTYRFDRLEKNEAYIFTKKEKKEPFEAKEEKKFVLRSYTFSMQWLNANPAVEIIAEDKSNEYFTNVSTDVLLKNAAYGFKKITYKNLYPNIDVSYVFHPDDGIKYNITLHPGANPSLIQMLYTGLNNISKDDQGNVHLNLPLGDVIDHAPKTFYENTGTEIPSSFFLNNNIVSFQLNNYDLTKTVVIDPWLTPVALQMTTNSRAYDVDMDAAGNVYVYGGFTPYKLAKYSPAGVAIWTYSYPIVATSYYGDMAVHPSGESYITEGCCEGERQKIRTNGTLAWGKTGGYEAWNIAINKCNPTQIVVAGYQISGGTGLLGKLNLTTGNYTFLSDPPVTTEYRSLYISPNGNVYGLTCPSLAGPGNSVVATNSALTLIYSVNSDYVTMAESGNLYATSSLGGFAGQNGIAADRCYLYTTNGGVLDKRDISTGEIINSVTIPGGTPESNSGVIVDSCGFVYVGSQAAVYKYDYDLIQVNLAPTPGAVYGLALGMNNELLACGNGFVASLALDVCKPVPCVQNPSLTLSSTTASCGTASGTATVKVNNGSMPTSYLWSNGQTTATAINLVPGVYTVTVTTACITLTGQVTVDNINGGTVTTSKTDVSCFGGSNGKAIATVTGGTAPYTYTWSPSGGNTDTAKNLPAGIYIVSVSDKNNCVQTGTITINEPLPFTANVSSTGSQCGQNVGTATVDPPVGGTPPYTYLWSPSAQTTATATNLGAGVYTCIITSSANCSQNFSVIVKNSDKPAVSLVSKKDILCNGYNNGMAVVSATGGTAPYTYAWTSTGIINDTITGLGPGTFICTVTDATGCQNFQSVNITQPTAISVIKSQTNASCNGYSDGMAMVTPTGGTPDYSYTWTPANAPDSLIQNLKAGTYNVAIKDINNCLLNETIIITEPATLGTTLTGKTSICSGGTTTLTAGGGVSYLWNTGAATPSITVSPTSTTNYSVTVTGTNGCKALRNQQVSVFQSPVPKISGKNIICVGESTVLTASGGGTYSWVTGETTQSITVNPAVARTYNVTVTGSNGCSDFAAFPMTVNANPTGSINGDPSVCEGETITLTASGGDNYLWDTGEDTPFINANPTGPTTYKVVVINNKGCKDTVSQLVTIDPLPIPIISGNTQICSGTSTTLTASGGDSYLWNTGETSSTITVSPASKSDYTVTAFSNMGCAADALHAINIVLTPIAVAGKDARVCVGDTAQLLGSGGTSTNATYKWSSTDYTFKSPLVALQQIPAKKSGVLTLYFTVFENGCNATDTLLLTIDPCELPAGLIPTEVFSPNGDGTNDVFRPYNTNVVSYNLQIYNRWGERIFESKDTDIGWDGTYGGGGDKVPQNVYVYLIVAIGKDGKPLNHTGTIMVVR